MFYTVCTKYIHVALAAYVLILWETFPFGHSCNFTVVLSKNVSTWNKTVGLFLFFNSQKSGNLFTLFCILKNGLIKSQVYGQFHTLICQGSKSNTFDFYFYLVQFGLVSYYWNIKSTSTGWLKKWGCNTKLIVYLVHFLETLTDSKCFPREIGHRCIFFFTFVY